MRALAALLFALLAGCSKPPPPGPFGESQNYLDSKARTFILAQMAGAPANIPGSITVDVDRVAKAKEDWIEVSLNGNVLARTRIWAAPGQRAIRVDHAVSFRPGGLNWLRLFSTAHDKMIEFQINTTIAKDYTLSPDGGSWKIDPPMPP